MKILQHIYILAHLSWIVLAETLLRGIRSCQFKSQLGLLLKNWPSIGHSHVYKVSLPWHPLKPVSLGWKLCKVPCICTGWKRLIFPNVHCQLNSQLPRISTAFWVHTRCHVHWLEWYMSISDIFMHQVLQVRSKCKVNPTTLKDPTFIHLLA